MRFVDGLVHVRCTPHQPVVLSASVVRSLRRAAGAHRSTRQRLSACDVGQTDAVGVTGSGAEEPAGSAHTNPDPAGWLLLVYRIPSDPTRLRATVWRRLKSLGAVYLQNSAAALPATDGAERALRRLRREILEMNGSAVLLSCSALAGEQDMVGLFQAARDDEYDEILDKCRDFHAGLEKEYGANHFTYGELEENEVELVKLKNWYAKVAARDVFGAPKRAAAVEALDACEQALERYAARVYAEQDEGG
jgi:Protein ChrB, N-terminal